MLTGCLGSMKDLDRARAGYDNAPFGKANPLIGILSEQRATLGPIFYFVLLPVRMDSSSDFLGQAFD